MAVADRSSRDYRQYPAEKVLSLNPKLVKAHRYFSTLFLSADHQLELAKKTLRNAGKIDTNNTTSLRYLRKVNAKTEGKKSFQKAEG